MKDHCINIGMKRCRRCLHLNQGYFLEQSLCIIDWYGQYDINTITKQSIISEAKSYPEDLQYLVAAIKLYYPKYKDVLEKLAVLI